LARTGLDERIVHGLSARNINTSKARRKTTVNSCATLADSRCARRQELLECSALDVSELLDVSNETAARVLKCAESSKAHCAHAQRVSSTSRERALHAGVWRTR
jgi:hypothetical protein